MVPEKKTIESFEDNQEITLEQTSTTEEVASTVLNETNGMQRKNDKKVKPLFVRRFITIIALFVAVIVLVVGTIVIKNLPKTSEEELQNQATSESIILNKIATDNIEKIVINGSYGEMVLVSKEKEKDTTSEESTSSDDYYGYLAEELYTWELQGYDNSLISSTEVNAAADNLATISATRIMEEDQSKKDLYGLNKPTVVAKVFLREGKGKDYTLTVGDLSPDRSGYYASITGDSKIYLISAGTVNNFNTSPESMAESVIVSTPTVDDFEKRTDKKKYCNEDDGLLATFDSIELSGSIYGQKAVITPIEDNEFVKYNIDLGSYTRYAEPDVVEEMFSLMGNGLVAIDTYALEPDAATIKKYGLDAPEASIAIKYGPLSTKLKATRYDDEHYAVMIDGRNAIYAVYADALPMLDFSLEQYYYAFVFQDYLTSFKTIEVETGKKSYVFDIKSKYDGSFAARGNGEPINGELLSAYYQYFLTLEPEVKDSYKDGKAALTATFTPTSESKDKVVIELIQQSARRYLVRINGSDYGIVNSTDYDPLVSYAEYVMDDRGIPEP